MEGGLVWQELEKHWQLEQHQRAPTAAKPRSLEFIVVVADGMSGLIVIVGLTAENLGTMQLRNKPRLLLILVSLAGFTTFKDKEEVCQSM
jgi:hypothetical protein